MTDEHVERARRVRSPAEAVELYAEWAATYDADVFGTLEFTGTMRIADLLAAHLPERDTPVLDLGCGTGAAGVRLQHHGFRAVDGVDISPEMLAVAAGTGAYRALVVADLTTGLDLPSRTYAASVSAGTFTAGHVDAGALPGIARTLRPGAVVAWVIGTAVWPQFRPALAQVGLEPVVATEEPIRRRGGDRATMLVARLDG